VRLDLLNLLIQLNLMNLLIQLVTQVLLLQVDFDDTRMDQRKYSTCSCSGKIGPRWLEHSKDSMKDVSFVSLFFGLLL